jgi:hypothetical protein
LLNHIITLPVGWKSHNICKYYVIPATTRQTAQHQSRDFATITRRHLPREDRSQGFTGESNAPMLTRSQMREKKHKKL